MESVLIVDSIVERCGGGNGKFQIISNLVLCLLFKTSSYLIFGFSFYELYPAVSCYGASSSELYPCTREEACERGVLFEYDFSDDYSIDNWIVQFDLLCISKVRMGVLGTLLFLGFTFGFVALSRMGDIYGRKAVALPMFFVTAVIHFILTKISSFYMLKLLIFLYGFLALPATTLVFIYVCELTTSKYQPLYTFLVMAIDGSTMSFLGIYFAYFKTVAPLFTIVGTAMIILSLLTYAFIPESPKYLYEKDKMNEFCEAIQYMANGNGKKMTIGEIKQVVSDVENSYRQVQMYSIRNPDFDLQFENQLMNARVNKGEKSVSHLISNRVYFRNAVALAATWGASSCSYYFIEFYMKYVPVDSIYVLAVLIGVCDILANAVFYLVKTYELETKRFLLWSFCLQVLVAAAITFVTFLQESSVVASASGVFALLTVTMRAISDVTFSIGYLANNEYFPPLLRSAVFAITNIVARVSTIFAPMIVEVLLYPSLTIAFISIVALICSSLLRKPISSYS